MRVFCGWLDLSPCEASQARSLPPKGGGQLWVSLILHVAVVSLAER